MEDINCGFCNSNSFELVQATAITYFIKCEHCEAMMVNLAKLKELNKKQELTLEQQFSEEINENEN